MKLRNARLSNEPSELFNDFTASLSFDYKLIKYDIIGSLVHINMLSKCDIVSKAEAKLIQSGLVEILKDFDEQKIEFCLADEDIHMAVEKMLTQKIGQVAGKLHTARSRNDQVALDEKLYIRDKIFEVKNLLIAVIESILKLATENIDVSLPGYTHLQRAQPVLFAHHIMAYGQMFLRDLDRFVSSIDRLNLSPLGSGAIAGTTFNIDREYSAKLLGFSAPTENSMDSVCDRDHILEFLSNTAISYSHFSKLAEELVIWSAQEFNFINLPDEFCTGSSMMPQKKNPDLAELVRGKTGRVYGNLISLLTTIKGLNLTYYKDLQEDKEPLFDSAETLTTTLILFADMIGKMKINSESMQTATEKDFSNATDVADYLATKGIPFREAYKLVGELVHYCLEKKVYLKDLTLDEFKNISPLFDSDIYLKLDITNVINSRKNYGGTAKVSVEKQIENLKQNLLKFTKIPIIIVKIEDLLV